MEDKIIENMRKELFIRDMIQAKSDLDYEEIYDRIIKPNDEPVRMYCMPLVISIYILIFCMYYITKWVT